MPAPAKIFLASSNPGKLREFQAMASMHSIAVSALPQFRDFPSFSEDAPTFAENAAGKALHYSRFANEVVFADDSGLVVPALGGAPGVRSARYAGENASDADRIVKLLGEMRAMRGEMREARFVCVVAAAMRGKAIAVFSDSVHGVISEEPRGQSGFGYDPVFYFPPSMRTFAQLSEAEKNKVSHRGKAFRKLLEFILETASPAIA